MGLAYQDRSRSIPFLFAPISFVDGCGYVDNFVLVPLVFPTSMCGMIGREAEMSATVGLEKPVPKMSPASLSSWLPLTTVDYLGHKPEFCKSGPATTSSTRRA
jgi:hypothetical protein